jgi:hypothetical protein
MMRLLGNLQDYAYDPSARGTDEECLYTWSNKNPWNKLHNDRSYYLDYVLPTTEVDRPDFFKTFDLVLTVGNKGGKEVRSAERIECGRHEENHEGNHEGHEGEEEDIHDVSDHYPVTLTWKPKKR